MNQGAKHVSSNSLILFILMTEAMCSPETSALTTATRRNIPEDGIFHGHRREILKFYVALTAWSM
jgi:hypothetical protein